MLVRQEALTTKMSIKDLPSSSPLPNANLVLVFGSVRRFSDGKLPAQLKERYPAAQIVGCTTSGEIGPHGVSDDSLQITAIAWDKTMQRVTYARANNMQTSAETAINLAKQLKSDSLRTVLVFSDGLHINGSELLQGFQSVLGNIPIVGGMAGDNAEFSKTLQLLNDSVEEGLVIAIGLYGDKLITASGALGGWKPYGPPRKITRSEKNVVYEMDGKPALPLYRMYIGEQNAKTLPGSGLRFPFAVIEEGKREVEKVRTLLAIDPARNSLTFAGNVEEGETVRLCQTTHDRLVEGAGGAARLVTGNLDTSQPGLALCVSCVGRKLVMADQIADEIQAVQQTLGSQTVLTGFYSYGEFCPRPNTTDNVLHNQTMTIGYLSEAL
ncbi:FIST C-terminal domain-containing protein [Methylobacillus flagellatus]|uniref:FIST signal transduction protein n=1 Tax=Methylobacillus flagellatus TaxID=405 RepID=UPI002853E135|nr:FIST N-terminal domain-containing protein [Methylobacillus flagellatus]MDR5171185.1 FIST C-terminal domain-containing protein [Methylobacillus flagellatus]